MACQRAGRVPGGLRPLLLAGLCVLRDEFFGKFLGVHGVLSRLLGEFVSSQMISFTVGDRGGSVGVGGKVVEFYGSIVQGLGHGGLLGRWMPLGAVYYADL